MRICVVTHSLYESDCRVMRYAEVLAGRGDEVEVIALQKEGKPAEEVIKGVKVSRVQKRSFQEKKRAAFLWQVMMFFVKATWLVTKRHLQKPYDVLHINSIPDFLVFVAVIPKLMGAGIILDIHDILPELYASKFGVSDKSPGFKVMLFLERISCAFSDHVIIANHIWRDRLLARSLPAEKCTVLLNYPDRSIFRAGLRSRESSEFVILYPGTLNQHQGLDVAIRAFAQVANERPEAMFYIHGEGRCQDELMQLVEEKGLQERVLFRPMLPIREIAKVMADADLAVVPKRKDNFGNEAFSTKIFEFMASGVPVIVSDTKIDKYYFNDSVVRFFESGNVDNLARTMSLVIADASLRRRMAANATGFVSLFDWEVNKGTYTNLVDSVARGKSSNEDYRAAGQVKHAAAQGSGRD